MVLSLETYLSTLLLDAILTLYFNNFDGDE